MWTLLATAILMTQTPTELDTYLARPSSVFSWKAVIAENERVDLDVVSHVWQGNTIRHTVSVVWPQKVAYPGTALLVITGGPVNAKDIEEARVLAEQSHMAVATIFDIPNQPLFDLREDALIAHTFVKFIETDDASWPLLFPMVKGTMHAMDAVEAWSKDGKDPIKRFVVTGASKRGWTAWFAGAAKDPRVIGIAPAVYDNLDIAAQMRHQTEMFGGFSERISDYTARDLQAMLETEPGKRLARIVDPFSYLANITVPTLILTGTNDPYWPVDAMGLYWDRLPMPHWARTLPNNGHTFEDKDAEHAAISSFAESCAGAFAMPSVAWTMSVDSKDRAATIGVKGKGVGFHRLVVWVATSETLDFRESKWSESARVSTDPPGTAEAPFGPVVRMKLPAGNCAVMPEMTFRIGEREVVLTLPVRVVRR